MQTIGLCVLQKQVRNMLENGKVIIIGAGNIGNRHLEGLTLSKTVSSIWVVDPSLNSLDNAKSIVEKSQNGKKFKVEYLSNFEMLPEDADLVIIATNSKQRLGALKSVSEVCTFKYLILEKFLFPAESQYTEAQNLLEQNNIEAYVNCPRREYNYYNEIKDYIQSNNLPFMFNLSGVNFGIACNGIHIIDLFAYLSGNSDFSFDMSGIDSTIHKSKRDGYIELTGRLVVTDEANNALVMTSHSEGDLANIISINTSQNKFIVNEGLGYMIKLSKDNGWKPEVISIPQIYLSTLSGSVVDNLILNGKTKLSNYKESMNLHIQFLKAITEFIETKEGVKLDICPIT